MCFKEHNFISLPLSFWADAGSVKLMICKDASDLVVKGEGSGLKEAQLPQSFRIIRMCLCTLTHCEGTWRS